MPPVAAKPDLAALGSGRSRQVGHAAGETLGFGSAAPASDVGRVWLEGEDSDTWHWSYGGGLWWAPWDLMNAIRVVYFTSDDECAFIPYSAAGDMWNTRYSSVIVFNAVSPSDITRAKPWSAMRVSRRFTATLARSDSGSISTAAAAAALNAT